MRFGADLAQLENYFTTALIPALNKHGIKTVGVFKAWRPMRLSIAARNSLPAAGIIAGFLATASCLYVFLCYLPARYGRSAK